MLALTGIEIHHCLWGLEREGGGELRKQRRL